MNMKSKFTFYFYFVSLFYLIVLQSNASDFLLYDLKTDAYPKISVKTVVFDKSNGTVVRNLKDSSFQVCENTEKLKIDSVICNSSIKNSSISALLTIDVSQSMNGEGIVFARSAAYQWILSMDKIVDEAAVTSFSDNAFLLQDYTSDDLLLYKAIDSLSLEGGTNYDVAFLDGKSGAFEVIKNSRSKKPVIIFLTDGEGKGNFDKILAKAIESNATVYTISFRIGLSDLLKNLSLKTGGLYFDNIKSQEDLIKVYKKIRDYELNPYYCELFWTSKGCILGRTVEVKVPTLNLSSTIQYNGNPEEFPKFEILPNEFLIFDNRPGEMDKSIKLSIRALKNDIDIATIVNNTPKNPFKITYLDSVPPFTLKKDSIFNINVTFSPKDSNFSFSKFEVIGSSCIKNYFYAVGGSQSISPGHSSIRIIHPNGREKILVNSESFISWEGTLPNQKVNVSFSNDAGLSWTFVDTNKNANSIKWQTPNFPSERCLVKVTQFSQQFGSKLSNINTDSANINCLDWSKEGTLIAAAADDSTVKLVNSYFGQVVSSYKIHNDKVRAVVWSPDVIRIASAGEDSKVYIYNTLINSISDSIVGFKSLINSLAWSPNGKYLAIATNDSAIYIYDVNTGFKFVRSLKGSDIGHKGNVNCIKFSNNSNFLASSSSDSSLIIYNVVDWTRKIKLKKHEASVTSIAWDPTDKFIASASGSPENLVYIWDIDVKKDTIQKFVNHKAGITSVAWNPIASKNLIASTGRDGLRVWSTIDAQEKNFHFESIFNHNSVIWSPEGARLADGFSAPNIAEKMDIFSTDIFPLQIAKSDTLFTLYNGSISTKNIDFGVVRLGSSYDSLFLKNIFFSINEFYHIDSMAIEDNSDSVFSFKTYSNPFRFNNIQNDSLIVRFIPKNEKKYTAKLVLFSKLGKNTIVLNGEGVAPKLVSKDFDFGEMLINQKLSINKQSFVLNKSNINVQINKIKAVKVDTLFQYKYDLADLNLNPLNDSLNLDISFSSASAYTYQNTLIFHFDNMKDSVKSQIYAKPINPILKTDSLIQFKDITCKGKDSKTLLIKNNGIGNLTLLDYKIVGNNPDNFKIINFKKDNKIKQLNNDSLIIEFEPKTEGLSTAILIIESKSIKGKDSIQLVGRRLTVDYTLSKNSVDFINVNPNSSKQDSVILTNIGEIALKWDLKFPIKSKSGKFELLSISPQLTLIGGGTSNFKFEFKGGIEGSFIQDSIELIDTCGDLIIFPLKAIVKNIAAKLIVDKPGNIEIPACTIDSMKYSIPIFNAGDKVLNVFDYYFENLNSSVKIDFINKVSSINPLTSDTIKFWIKASRPGEFNCDLKIKSNSESSIKTDSLEIVKIKFVYNKAVYSIMNSNFNFKFDGVNSYLKDSTFIKNESVNDLNLKVSTSSNNIKINSNSNLTIKKDSTFQIKFEYTGNQSTNKIEEFIYLIDSCGNQKTINISIYPSETVYMDLLVSEIESQTGSIIDIPVSVLKVSNLDINKIPKVNIDLKYNSTCIYPINAKKIAVIGEELTATFEFNSSEIKENSILRIPHKVLLGNDSISKISIPNIELVPNDIMPIKFTEIEGKLTITNLCKAGGTRFYIKSDSLIALTVNPNPINDFLSLEFNLIEDVPYSISIFDIEGKELFKNVYKSKPGKINLDLNVSNLPIGTYNLIVEHGQFIQSKHIKILK